MCVCVYVENKLKWNGIIGVFFLLLLVLLMPPPPTKTTMTTSPRTANGIVYINEMKQAFQFKFNIAF